MLTFKGSHHEIFFIFTETKMNDSTIRLSADASALMEMASAKNDEAALTDRKSDKRSRHLFAGVPFLITDKCGITPLGDHL